MWPPSGGLSRRSGHGLVPSLPVALLCYVTLLACWGAGWEGQSRARGLLPHFSLPACSSPILTFDAGFSLLCFLLPRLCFLGRGNCEPSVCRDPASSGVLDLHGQSTGRPPPPHGGTGQRAWAPASWPVGSAAGCRAGVDPLPRFQHSAPMVTSNPEGFRILVPVVGRHSLFLSSAQLLLSDSSLLEQSKPPGSYRQARFDHPRAAGQLGNQPPLRSRWCSSLLSHFSPCLVPSVLTQGRATLKTLAQGEVLSERNW